MKSPTERFSARVGNYVKYRPSYPEGVVATLRDKCGLSPQSAVADIGSGTGILTRLLLEAGAEVFGVEPNSGMRAAAERLLDGYPRFVSRDGRAEATGLVRDSIGIITAAQAFHWFDWDQTKSEFERILKPGGWVALIWNKRRTDSAFGQAYESLLLEHAAEYSAVDHRRVTDDDIAAFFEPSEFASATFENHQTFGFESLKGRVMSSSYAPTEEDPKHQLLMAGLRTIFDANAGNGVVRFEYVTHLYYGQLPQE
jgi:ubiquinone/menaquinone biosynthesis C-methylase UbiE